MDENDLKSIEDLPKGGPLADYRDKASFNWKKMKLFFEDIDSINFKVIEKSFSLLRFDSRTINIYI
jgi:hypothetical protein